MARARKESSLSRRRGIFKAAILWSAVVAAASWGLCGALEL